MNYCEIKVKPLSDRQIREMADNIRAKFWGNKIPVDIENILEVGLKMSIIPLPGLKIQISFDSFISSDWKNVYVDNDSYMSDKYYRRIRFSLAHELGHFVLHKDFFESLKIKSIEDYYRFYNEVPNDQYRFLEDQANKFAGYLLIPYEIMKKHRDRLLAEYQKKLIGTDLENIDIDLSDYIVGDMTDIFNVSTQAMEIGLKN